MQNKKYMLPEMWWKNGLKELFLFPYSLFWEIKRNIQSPWQQRMFALGLGATIRDIIAVTVMHSATRNSPYIPYRNRNYLQCKWCELRNHIISRWITIVRVIVVLRSTVWGNFDPTFRQPERKSSSQSSELWIVSTFYKRLSRLGFSSPNWHLGRNLNVRLI